MPTKEDVMSALTHVYDPEVMMHIVDLGLVYKVEVEDKKVRIEYTLTAPGCPLSHVIEADIYNHVGQVEGIEDVVAEVVWEPAWTPEMMSEEAKLALGYDV